MSNYSTSTKSGVDVTAQYNVSASVTPETPAPPFSLGDMVEGVNGAKYTFVQASTSIAIGDFIVITNSGQANAMTNTNVVASVGAKIGHTGATVAGSVTFIPAGAYFWAALAGSGFIGSVNSVGCTTAPEVQLFTSATAGAVTSVTTSSTLAAGLSGIECVLSATVTTSGGVFMLTWPRTEAVYSSAGGTLSVIAQA